MNNDNAAALEFLHTHLRRPVVLVGMMGVGKTHVGRKLAEKLNMPFKDSDKIIEQRAGRAVTDIFEQFGEEKFRQAERNAVLEILAGDPCVLATGGGAVLNAETRKAIKSKSVSVWLNSSVADILKRIGIADDRPLLKKGDPETILKALLKERAPLYAEADIHVESRGAHSDETISNLINLLYEHLKEATV